jgi:type IX secretion system PorP/SprF family membrane protein
MEKFKYSAIIILMMYQILNNKVQAQQSPLITHYMLNPLILNPAFAGNRNSVAIDVSSRQQWLGIEGAPSFYYAGIHAPLNRSKVSLGATILSEQTGPLLYNRLAFDYAYLIRTSWQSFISLGLCAGIDHLNFDLQSLNIIDYNDPEFSKSIENEIRPSIGAGFVFFTPLWYVGISIPHYAIANVPWASDPAINFKTRYEINFTGGYHFNITRDFDLKLSAIHRMVRDEISTTDISVMLRHSDGIKGGLNYRFNKAAGLLAGVQITKETDIFYSFEFPTSWDPLLKKGIHELTVTFDLTKYIRPNRDRRFLRRRKKEESKEEMNSIRYF